MKTPRVDPLEFDPDETEGRALYRRRADNQAAVDALHYRLERRRKLLSF